MRSWNHSPRAISNVPRRCSSPTDFAANYALIATLVGRDDVVVFDALCHASMRDGMRAAQCRTIKAAHNDLDAFEDALRQPRDAGASLWILAESIYSMDGDIAPVRGLLALAEKYDAILIIDEAHSTGVSGATGRGETEGLPHERLIVLHTCGKALGVAGALVCANEAVIDYLINAARPFVFSTAPMPLQALLVKRALELVRDEPERRERLSALKALAAARLPGFSVQSQIVPIVVGRDDAAVELAKALQARGFDIRAIRPPSVPEGTARLRLSLNAGLRPARYRGIFRRIAAPAAANLRMTKTFVVAGTDTGIGKTTVAAMLMLGLNGRYWKPIQSGTEDGTDSERVRTLTALADDRFVPESYVLSQPLSPHRAAEIDGIEIETARLALPETNGTLIVEAAGGLLVPVTRRTLQIEMFAAWGAPVVLCARTALGTINHTLLSIEALRNRSVALHGLVFVGDDNPDSIRTIAEFSDSRVLGRLPWLEIIDRAALLRRVCGTVQVEGF